MKNFIFALITAIAISLAAQAVTAEAMQTRYFGQRDDAVAGSLPYGNNAAAEHYVQAGDVKIYYELYGEGEPMLVLHGGGVGCTFEMGRFIDELSKNFLVIAPSTRGHGKSEIGIEKITYEQKADDMMAAVNAVTDKPFGILGFSDGAYTAYKIASIYPDRVTKVIAIGAGENIPALRKIPLSTLDEFAAYDAEFIKEKIALCPEPEKLQDYLNEYFTFFNNERISKELFSTIKCPVLVMAGELDPNAPLDTVISAYKMIPRAELAIIPAVGHGAFVENFEAVWACVKPFLEQK